jgi:hypothetical protein
MSVRTIYILNLLMRFLNYIKPLVPNQLKNLREASSKQS